jgi:dipeptidyl aminopeptidase/acylaminoacyl peptidase
MRRFYRHVLALSVLAALAACDEARTPLDPADDGEPSQAAEPAAAFADLTTARIAFESWSAVERADIWTVDPQGAGYVHLTGTAVSEYSPVWSYDHKRVAFVRPRLDANKVWHNDIYVMNADGTNKHWARSATSTSDIDNPNWSPDGTRLVVTTRLQGFSVLSTLNLSTGSLATVAPSGLPAVHGFKASYDPAGKSILYLDSQTNKIHRLVPGGADKVLLTADRTIVSATFSPDGTKVAADTWRTTTPRSSC